ncbi:MAG: polymer-forming cytoskeletal protein [Deltaproteobacteria bacterium]|uniref:Polymer-forming cytoskeletal protein n=1 Tax=Candidatus Zymogenus saltonus TaxID=2844893 RepID=A0A9D8KCM7_9DELT|nr:polymer-forming cytoskeletal protein [Candidatus Zymogenus saltonus]
MGIFDKKGTGSTGDVGRAAPQPSYIETKSGLDCDCYIAEGITVEGKITGNKSVGIDGNFKGELDISSKVVVGETGEIKGNITAEDVEISGKVVGNIIADNFMEAKPTGQIIGDIEASRLVIEDGAIFEGNITMSKKKKAKTEAASAITMGDVSEASEEETTY